ncbi:Alpha-D-kanosaminyltransferase [Phycisphaerae bacterium RAS1]|nr:Alpha-D-kanosaminyltransferase [Phycisphaerae bacterium RAS1]
MSTAAPTAVRDDAQPRGATPAARERVGAVCIGRNEGERLLRCIRALQTRVGLIVFADSGSTDGSADAAAALGAVVVRLDPRQPQSAARARNAGFDRLRELRPDLTLVHFVDGDTEIAPQWLDAALSEFDHDPTLVILCGRLREKDRQHSIYRRLCDMEWDGPIGDIESCGGNMLVRAVAFEAAGRFDISLIAGEEAQFCARVRASGGRIRRIAADMGVHDSGMTRFGEWWRRAARAGFWEAAAYSRAASGMPRPYARRIAARRLWAGVLPLLLVASLTAAAWYWPAWLAAAAGLLAYAASFTRIRRFARRRGWPPADCTLYSASCMLAKWPELQGQLQFAFSRGQRRSTAFNDLKTSLRRAENSSDAAAAYTMNLAYLATQYPAVSHTFIRREILELERRGHRVLRLAIRPAEGRLVDPVDVDEADKTLHCLSQPLWRLLLASIVAPLRHPLRYFDALRVAIRMGRRSERGLLIHLVYLVEAAYLLSVVRRGGVQRVHVHFGTNSAAVARLMHRLGGPPYSFTVHGPDEFDAPRALDLAGKIHDAAFVVGISEYTAAQLRRWAAPADWPRIQVIRCGVDDAFFRTDAASVGDSRTFVCVGRLSAQKGHRVLVDAFARLMQAGGDARLVLAGDGELRGAIEEQIDRLKIAPCVEITGWISGAEVRRRLEAARAMVLPSFAEGLPMVIMEAFALRRPVISTYVAGIPELVRDGENGWLVPAGSVEELARAMRAALDASAARLDELGAAGAARVRDRHYVPTEVDRLERLLRAVKAE